MSSSVDSDRAKINRITSRLLLKIMDGKHRKNSCFLLNRFYCRVDLQSFYRNLQSSFFTFRLYFKIFIPYGSHVQTKKIGILTNVNYLTRILVSNFYFPNSIDIVSETQALWHPPCTSNDKKADIKKATKAVKI